MGKTYYKRKREKTSFTTCDIARQLDINELRYKSIENGIIKMPKNLIDKFNVIVNQNKIQQIEETETNKSQVEEWFKDIVSNDSNHKKKILDKMKEFNINNFNELAELLGYNKGTLQTYLCPNAKISFNFKNKLYLFFHNELNIQLPHEPKEEKVKKSSITTYCEFDEKIYNWYKDFDFKKFMSNNSIKYRMFSEGSKLSTGVLSNIIHHRNNISLPSLYKCYNFIHNYCTDNIINIDDYNLVNESNKTDNVIEITDITECKDTLKNEVVINSNNESFVLKYMGRMKDCSDEIERIEDKKEIGIECNIEEEQSKPPNLIKQTSVSEIIGEQKEKLVLKYDIYKDILNDIQKEA